MSSDAAVGRATFFAEAASLCVASAPDGATGVRSLPRGGGEEYYHGRYQLTRPAGLT